MLATSASVGDFSTLQNRHDPSRAEQTTPRVLTILASVLEKLVARNDRLVQESSGHALEGRFGNSLSGFHGVRAPGISIAKYLERLYKYSSCSPSCFVVGYVYIDRLLHKFPYSLVVSLNVHRLLVTAVMVASKTLDDVHYNNAFYARVGGVSNSELNRLELELLFLLDFGVTVSPRDFEVYCLHLEKEILILNPASSHTIERPITSNGLHDVTHIEYINNNNNNNHNNT